MEQGFSQGSILAVQGLSALDAWLFVLAAVNRGLVVAPLNPKYTGKYWQTYEQQVPFRMLINGAVWQHIQTSYVEESGQEREFRLGPIAEHEPAILIFTSGSTGAPKGIVHTWSSLTASAQATIDFYQFGSDHSWFLSLGLHHIGGLMIPIRCLQAKAEVILADPGLGLAEDLLRQRPDFISLVPTQLADLLQDARVIDVLRRCRAILLGGAAAPPALIEHCRQLALPVSLTYGCSEAASQLTAATPGCFPGEPGWVGQPLPGKELKLEPATGRIWFRSSASLCGFWQAQRWQPHEPGEWYPTSDRGDWVDGDLYVMERLDDVFMCGGETLSRSEIQRVVDGLNLAERALVLKYPDDRLGWVPVLLIQALRRPQVDSFWPLLRQSLPSIQQPRHILWQPVESASGKPFLSQLEARIAAAPEGFEWLGQRPRD
jgi:O-succinylbenzoic acid--CoA ligase